MKPTSMENDEAYNPWKESSGDVLPQVAGTSYTAASNSDLGREVGTSTLEDTRASADILEEFDPLADAKKSEVMHAQETPEKAEQTPDAIVHSSESQTSPSTSAPSRSNKPGSVSGISIPSLVSLAKSLTLSRNRPPSQELASKDLPNQSTRNTSPVNAPAEPTLENGSPRTANNMLGMEMSRTGRDFERHEPDEPPAFDFQKFLDQMKTKGAEPVAKYLRSYVGFSYVLCRNTTKFGHQIFEQFRQTYLSRE